MQILFVALLAFSNPVQAENREGFVLVENPATLHMNINDTFCLSSRGKQIACGQVQSVFSKSSLVKMAYSGTLPEVGEMLAVSVQRTGETTSTTDNHSFLVTSQTADSIEISPRTALAENANGAQLAFAMMVLNRPETTEKADAGEPRAYWPKAKKGSGEGSLFGITAMKPVRTLPAQLSR